MKSKIRTIIMVVMMIGMYSPLRAQLGVNSDNSAPNSKAMLDVKSSDKGMLVPRLTTVQRNAITSPPDGLMVYDTETHSFWFYRSTYWAEVSTGISGTGATNQVAFWNSPTSLGSHFNLYWDNSNQRMGIGTSVPNASARLTVSATSPYAALFSTNSEVFPCHVIHSEYLGGGANNATAVYGRSVPADYFGWGGYFEGGYRGVVGRVNPTGNLDYKGVLGVVDGGTGTNTGVSGESTGSGTNIGVSGEATGNGLSNMGVWGKAENQRDLQDAVGLYGEAEASNNPQNCITAGVRGYAHGNGSLLVGVRGDGEYGVQGFGTNIGVLGDGHLGVCGESDYIGVNGISRAANGIGIRGFASEGEGIAGYFFGDVEINGDLSKSGGFFKIDHPVDPANKFLIHSFVESPERKNVYDGIAILDVNGSAIVELPSYFEALNKDFRYQLTCIGAFAPVYIKEEISEGHFTIAGGQKGLKVSWQVTGIRHDPYAEKKGMQVEVDKNRDQKGKYLHPELFGMPVEKGIEYGKIPSRLNK